jgi:hypothetical protein
LVTNPEGFDFVFPLLSSVFFSAFIAAVALLKLSEEVLI